MSARKSLPSQRRRRLKLYRRKAFAREQRTDAVHVIDYIGAGPAFDIEDDGRLPIEPARHPAVLDAVADGADIPQPNRRAVAISDDGLQGVASGKSCRHLPRGRGGRARTEPLP